MSRADELRAELAMAEAEEALVAAKAKKSTTPDELRKVKQEVRDARQAYREARDSGEEN